MVVTELRVLSLRSNRLSSIYYSEVMWANTMCLDVGIRRHFQVYC
jgi:hypothetical protein